MLELVKVANNELLRSYCAMVPQNRDQVEHRKFRVWYDIKPDEGGISSYVTTI